MSNVIQGNFKQVVRDYGHKKITQKGVETLEEVQHRLLNKSSLSSNDIFMLSNMLNDVLTFECVGKYQMTIGHERV